MRDTSQTERSGTFRVLKWMLGAQVALAALLVLIDLGPTLPGLLQPSSAPGLEQPTAPGDQVRHYQPTRPSRPTPGISPDMPRRLIAEEIELDGASGLRLRGTISPGDGQRIADEVQQMRPQVVLLDSPGGSVTDALTIGRTLRDLDVKTELAKNAVCLSACPYIFVGGTTRTVSDDARFGVHQHSFGKSTVLPAFLAVEDIQRGQAAVLAHLSEMGVDLRIMGPALATPADEIYILSRQEMVDWKVISEDPA